MITLNGTRRRVITFVLLTIMILSLFSGCGERGKSATEKDARTYVEKMGYEKCEYVGDFFYSNQVIFRYHGYHKQDGYKCKVDKIDVIYPALEQGYGEPKVEAKYYGTSWNGIIGTWKYQDAERNFSLTIYVVDDGKATISYDLDGIKRSTGVISSEMVHVQSNGKISTEFDGYDDYCTISIPEAGIGLIWINGNDGVSIDGKYLSKVK